MRLAERFPLFSALIIFGALKDIDYICFNSVGFGCAYLNSVPAARNINGEISDVVFRAGFVFGRLLGNVFGFFLCLR